MRDIEEKQLRLIGDAEHRYQEDPVRMLRAARFAAKLGFTIAEEVARPIHSMAGLLNDVSEARLYEEFNKLFLGGYGQACFESLQQFPLFGILFPDASQCMQQNAHSQKLFSLALANTDQRVQESLPVTPAFIIAALLWGAMRKQADELMSNGVIEHDAIQLAGDSLISRQVKTVAMPRRMTLMAREIWTLQARLKNRRGKRPMRLLGHPRFRAAFDFLVIRQQAGENLHELVDWWQDFQEQNPDLMYKKTSTVPNRRRRRPRKRKADNSN